METCLVTGGTGLVGSHLLPQLVNQYEVYVLTYEESELLNRLPVKFIQADLSLPGWEQKLPESIDHVVHLAQSEYFRDFPAKAAHLFRVNTLACLQLVQFAVERGAKSFVHTSTGGVYGFPEEDCDAEQPLTLDQNLGFYPVTKLCAELVAHSFESFISVWTLRPFFIYGQGQQRHMLIPRLVDSVVEGRPIKLQGDEGLRINPVHASDAAAMILACIGREGSGKLNLAGPEELSLRQIGEIVGRELGKEPVFEQDLSAKAPRLVADLCLTEQTLSWVPNVRFCEGVRSLLPFSC